MIKCGVTGFSGNLEKLLKSNKNLKFIKFKGDIRKKKIFINGSRITILIF